MNAPLENAVNEDAFSLHGKTAVVTGSSSGMGRAIAVELARGGADVVVHARRSKKEAEQTVATIRALGQDVVALFCDIAKPDVRNEFVEQAWNWRGGVDIWVNNAGVDVLTGEARDWPFEEKLAALWRVDVEGTVSLSRQIGERMKARGSGVLLNMGWDQAEYGMQGDSGEMFAAAKGAVMAFTKSLARSLAPEVRVNCLAPGWIKTSWGENASDYWQQRAKSESLLGRWGEVDDVARVARFLASPAADFINGQVIPINGGYNRQ